MTERRRWDGNREYEHQRELAQTRRQWDAAQKQRKEQNERAEKQARLEAHLCRRSEAYQDTAGSPLPSTALQEWTMEYMNRQEQKHQRERAERLARAEAQYEH